MNGHGDGVLNHQSCAAIYRGANRVTPNLYRRSVPFENPRNIRKEHKNSGGGGVYSIYFPTDTPSFSALVRQPFTIFSNFFFFFFFLFQTLLFFEQIARAWLSSRESRTRCCCERNKEKKKTTRSLRRWESDSPIGANYFNDSTIFFFLFNY